DVVVTLGDYVDRGPDSYAVLERLLALHGRGQLIALRGNHDEMMLTACQGNDLGLWLSCGGGHTMHSYGIDPTCPRLDLVPDEHLSFLRHVCVRYHETPTHFFVHGNVIPELPLESQPEHILYWGKLYEPAPHVSGKVMVCGHTRQASGRPLDWKHTICIDTGA